MVATASFESLVVEFLPTLRRRACRLARTRHDADDLVQDALLRALCRRDQIRSTATARGWLLTIVWSTFLDHHRRGRLRPVELAHDPLAPGASEEPAWGALSIDDIRAAVDRLPDDVRDAYRMFAFEGSDYVTIARVLEIPKGTVGSRIARARGQLRALLLPDQPQSPLV
jgi:RNA polymerase sigma-70 factor, ECF subfamily